MTPAEVAALIAEVGEDATLRRPGTPDVDVSVAASIRDYMADELTGNVQQGDRTASISNGEIAAAEWPGPPRQNDQFIDADGKLWNVEHVESLRIGPSYARHNLRIRG